MTRHGALGSAVILAKHTDEAKSRMRLPPELTRRLALALAAMTTRTILTADSVASVIVVTADPTIADDALGVGADVVHEGRSRGMNHAAELGRRRAMQLRPEAPVAILVADLPHLRSRDVDALFAEYDACQQSLYVPDHHGIGTTVLLQAPRRNLGFAFGRQSARMHSQLGYQEAHRAGHGLRTDLDTRDDLADESASIGCPDREIELRWPMGHDLRDALNSPSTDGGLA